VILKAAAVVVCSGVLALHVEPGKRAKNGGQERSADELQPKARALFDWSGPRSVISRNKGRGTERALLRGLRWLVDHQHDEGYWSGDGFLTECERLGTVPCSSAGLPGLEEGLTGLALMALTSAYENASDGSGEELREAIDRGIGWLVSVADPGSGRIGRRRRHDWIYGHLIATHALCDAYDLLETDPQRKVVRKALEFILQARSPFMAWRYEVPPIGDNDTSITVWALSALGAALERDIVFADEVEEAIAGGLWWLNEVTDKSSGGRVGYDGIGTLSARTLDNERFPRDQGEAMTAAAMWAHYAVGSVKGREELLEAQARLLLTKPPILVEDLVKLRKNQEKKRQKDRKKEERKLEKGKKLPPLRPLSEPYPGDMYYWYHGTNAMFQFGGRAWDTWNKELKKVALELQCDKGPAKGSWDPDGPWGLVGGRVYSTAIMVLCLEVYFRYPRYE